MRAWPPWVVIAVALVSSLAAPLAGDAQQAAKVWRIGMFHVGLDHVPPSVATFREGLRALGYEDGKDVLLDWRNLPDEAAAREVAQEFVRDGVDLIVALENHTIRAAQAATSKIPIVFLHSVDPVASGFVQSLSRPGGNLTGFIGTGDLPAKRIELFKELVPQLERLLVLVDPDDPLTPGRLAAVRRASATLKVHLVDREAADATEIERVFRRLRPGEVDGVDLLSPNLYLKFTSLALRLAAERGLPLVSNRGEWVPRGALFPYAHDLAKVGPLAARYVDRILKGARPADLPVQEPSRFVLTINLRTARALGLTIPPAFLLRADQVIE